MMEFNIKSKLYITPKNRNYFLLIVLNICMVIIAIMSLLSILGDGAKIGNISPIIIGLFIVIRSKAWFKSEPYYEFSMAHVILNKDVCISYENGQEVTIYTDSIVSIEYSDRLECLRFIADYNVLTKSGSVIHNRNEFLFYIDALENNLFLKALEKHTGKDIMYVDRDANA